jgi:hypothetical protein
VQAQPQGDDETHYDIFITTLYNLLKVLSSPAARLKGPKCSSNKDCKKFRHCLRCAHSGYCTEEK